MMHRIYLDWNATAPLLPEVREAMTRALGETFGNASSVHREGQSARSVVERARRAVAGAMNAPPQSVIMTGGATEANNQVLRHHVRVFDEPHVACSAVEHPSVLEVVEELGRTGVSTSIIDVDRAGRIDDESLHEALSEGSTLVSVMLANNETGNVYPIAEIADSVHESGALLHVDATQALGRVPIDFEALGADFLTLSFHKCGGPKGIGAVVVREGLKVEAILAGGHQERGRRPGTENVPAAAGLDAAARCVRERVARWNTELERKRDLFLGALGEIDLEVRGDPDSRLPNTVNLAFPDADGEDVLLALDLEGVAASSGSACTAGSLEPSHVILAMGYPETDARRSVRFSFGPSTTDEELREAAEAIVRVVQRIRSV
jgi:cysteine desulfurase